MLLLSIGPSTETAASIPTLPVDPHLSTNPLTLPLPLLPSDSVGERPAAAKLPTSIIADGMPPIPTKILEKIQRWEYIELSTLLEGASYESPSVTVSHDGQLLVLETTDKAKSRRKTISDVTMWVQAYTRFMAALVSADTTTKQESVGLAAHLHLILQLYKDLAGPQWLRYDKEFREWAAARGVRKWGELNLTIYGRCLSGQQSLSVPKEVHSQGTRHIGDKRRNTGHGGEAACFKWNFGEGCNKTPCRFSHTCLHCSGTHRAKSCHLLSKRNKQS